MKSLKLKFIFLITLFVVGIVILVSGSIYVINVRSIQDPIRQQELNLISDKNPRFKSVIERLKELDRIEELGEELKEREEERLRRSLLITLPVSLLLSVTVSYLLSNYLVSPIEKVTTQIKAIRHSNDMSKRIISLQSSEEIVYLIDSFNGLLDTYEENFKIQERFLQDAAHELRTPIAAMKTNIEVFQSKKDLHMSDYKNLFDTIKILNDKLTKLVNNLFLLNSIQKNLETEEVDVNEIIEDVIESYFTELEKLSINVITDIKPSNDKLKINPDDFISLLNNLIENSIKYRSEIKPFIKIKTEWSDKYLFIYLKDNGQGIAKKYQSKIFDRFFRSPDMASDSDGEGIGLSIVKAIIDKYEGDIELDSEKDKGTEFKIKLPRN